MERRNPCYDGRGYFRKQEEAKKVIDALQVVILVMMEEGILETKSIKSPRRGKVVILVMMEEGILEYLSGTVSTETSGRNPCYDGRGYFSYCSFDNTFQHCVVILVMMEEGILVQGGWVIQREIMLS